MIITFNTMPKARTHQENRHEVCLLCFGKTKKMLLVQGALKSHIEKYFTYDTDDDRLPLVVCTSCKRDIYKIKDDPQQSIKLPDFSSLKPVTKFTRSSNDTPCACHICELARKPKTKNFGNFAKGNILPERKSILTKGTAERVSGEFSRNILSNPSSSFLLGTIYNFKPLSFFQEVKQVHLSM